MRNCFSAAGLFAVLVVLATPAYAYLDPGTGSIILQGLIAGIAAAGTIISINYHRFKAKVRKVFGMTKDDSSAK